MVVKNRYQQSKIVGLILLIQAKILIIKKNKLNKLMPKIDWDIAIFITFLVINLIVGWFYGRRVKNIREYAVGSKNFSTAVLTATLVATWASGSALFLNIENTYSKGLYYIITQIGLPIGLLLSAQLAARMGKFLNNLSVAEMMRDLYGEKVEIITAISGIAAKIGYTAIQFKAITKMLAMVFGLEGNLVTILAAGIIIAYSAFGGIKAVTFTDVLQFFTFGTIIPILALAIWNHLEEPTQIVSTLATNPNFNLKNVISWTPQFRSTLSLLLYFAIPGIYAPEIFQRVAMAKDIQQVKRSMTYAAGFFLLIALFMVWIGILLLTDNPNLKANEVVGFMINKHTYVGLRGLFGVGIMALAMSTADSCLNASSVLFSNDVIRPLFKQAQSSVFIARLFSTVTGTAALLLALYKQDLLSMLLLSGSLYMPIFTVPMLLAVLGFRSSTRAVLIGMAAGFSTVILWSIIFENSSSIVPGMLANLVFLMASHYGLKETGGWIESENWLHKIQQKIYRFAQALIKLLNPKTLINYLESNLPQKEYFYSLLSFYLLTATYTSLYNLPQAIEQKYLLTYRIIQYSVLLITTSLMAFPIWPAKLKNNLLLRFLWPVVIFYSLFLVGGVLVILSNFQTAQVLIFMLNIVITVLFIDWRLALALAVAGFMAAIAYFQYGLHQDISSIHADGLSFKISYGFLLFSSLLIALVRQRQAQAHLATYNAHLLETQREIRQELVRALNAREELLQELNPEEIALFDTTTTAYIQQAIYRVKNYLRLQVSEIKLADLFDALQQALKIQGLAAGVQFKQSMGEAVLQADIPKIKKLLINSITYLKKHVKADQIITINIDRTLLGHNIAHIPDYIRKLDAYQFTISTAQEMPPQEDIYMISPIQSQIPQAESELALTDNARIIDAHYGYADTKQATTHVYVIPSNVREVRGKVMELLREPVSADPDELQHPLAIHLEKELLNKLQPTAVQLGIIHKALKLIKQYHGGIRRKSGEPFFTHPMAVALILLDYSQDQNAVLATLLHDTIEDTRLSMAELEALFGADVAFLVGKATNLEDRIRRISLEDHENTHRLINYEDERAALVKLSDRLHNMRTIEGHPSLAKQKYVANETLSFFVPMAKYLNLHPMADELEQLSLRVLANKK